MTDANLSNVESLELAQLHSTGYYTKAAVAGTSAPYALPGVLTARSPLLKIVPVERRPVDVDAGLEMSVADAAARARRFAARLPEGVDVDLGDDS